MSDGDPLVVPQVASRWDRLALRAGASVAITFAVPFLVIAVVFVDEGEDTGLALVTFLGTMAGFVLGGGCAAWVQRTGFPLAHGLATSVGTYVVAQVLLIPVALVRDGDVNVVAILFNVTVTAFAGLIGGFLGARLQAKGIRPRSLGDAGGLDPH